MVSLAPDTAALVTAPQATAPRAAAPVPMPPRSLSAAEYRRLADEAEKAEQRDRLPIDAWVGYCKGRLDIQRHVAVTGIADTMSDVRAYLARATMLGRTDVADRLTGLLDSATTQIKDALYGGGPAWPGPDRTNDQQCAWKAAMMEYHRERLRRAQRVFAAEVHSLVSWAEEEAREGDAGLAARYVEIALGAYGGAERVWDAEHGASMRAEIRRRTAQDWRDAFAADRAAELAQCARADAGEPLEGDGQWEYDTPYQIVDHITDEISRGHRDDARELLALLCEESQITRLAHVDHETTNGHDTLALVGAGGAA